MYPPKYVETLVSELENPYVVAVSSLWSYIPDKNHSWIGLTIYELLRDTYLFFQSFKRPELSVRGLVFAYNVEYGKKVGYRVDIIRGEDGSMAYGLLKYGKIKFCMLQIGFKILLLFIRFKVRSYLQIYYENML
jgi:hypothetical protein